MKNLVTGPRTGFGNLINQTFLQSGHKVTATIRDPKGKNKKWADILKDKGTFNSRI